MRELGSLPHEAEARRLADYLLTQGIATKLDRVGEGWTLWVRQEMHVPRAREEFAAFRASPDDPRYVASTATAQAILRDEERREAEYRRRYIDVSRRWGTLAAQSTRATFAMVALSAIVSFLGDFGQNLAVYGSLSLLPPLRIDMLFRPTLVDTLRSGEWWRLVTPIFLHGSPMHLLFNMLILWDFGRQLERYLRPLRYLALVLGLAVVSNLVQYAFEGPSIGMSGVL